MSVDTTNTLPRALPLAVFEHYMLLDDRPQHPMVFRFCLQLSGASINVERLQQSIDATLGRHPLLRSNVLRNVRRRTPVWQPAADPQVTIEIVNALPETVAPIDLATHIGLRVLLCVEEPQTLLFDFHHSCCDGLGAVQFIREVADTYSNHDHQQPAHRVRVPLTAVRSQESVLKRFGRFMLRLPQETIGGLALLEYFPHRPISLSRPQTENDIEPQAGISFHSASLSAEKFAALRSELKHSSLTVNDHLIASVTQGTSDWLLEQDGHHPQQGHLRVLIPMNLRTNEDAAGNSTNVVTMVYLDRRPWRHASFEKLRRWMRIEMQCVKRFQLGHTFLRLLEFCDSSRIGIAALLPPDRCLGTTLATNLGQPFVDQNSPSPDDALHFGSTSVEDVRFFPPVRPLTPATFGVITYRSRFTLCMTRNRAEMSDSAAQLLFDKVAARFSEGYCD